MPANTKDCPYSQDQDNQPLLRSTYPETGTVASATSVASYMELIHPTTIVDESPIQTYPTVIRGSLTVSCRVCQNIVNISGKQDSHVIKCPACNEATPIRNAPVGRKYVRCKCNCLLICKTNSARISCPRPNCKRVTNLHPALRNAPYTISGFSRIICAHCEETFVFMTRGNLLAVYPHCKKKSSVDGKIYNETVQSRGKRYFFFVVLTLVITIALTTIIAVLDPVDHNYWLTFFMGFSGFIFSAILAAKAYFYLTMKSSQVEGEV